MSIKGFCRTSTPYNVVVRRWTTICARAPVAAGVALAVVGLAGCATGTGVERSEIPRGWPVPYDIAQISSDFGAPRGSSRHQGLDLRAPKGTEVRATADGRVIFAGKAGDFGRLVIIEHSGGYETRYAHLKSIEVKKGRTVQRGTIVGTVGKSGNATGFHLHYEVRLQGTAVNPRSYL
jgi:murein DD-endopeptidase MepM/ murein hydrolase activator NlpD